LLSEPIITLRQPSKSSIINPITCGMSTCLG
jgi:hypothetical protein